METQSQAFSNDSIDPSNLLYTTSCELLGLYSTLHSLFRPTSTPSTTPDTQTALTSLTTYHLALFLPRGSPTYTLLSVPDPNPPSYDRLAVLVLLSLNLISLARLPTNPVSHKPTTTYHLINHTWAPANPSPTSTSPVTNYFTNITRFKHLQHLDRTPCLWVLFWTLMLRADNYSIADPEMVWLTARVLWCVKRLGNDTRLEVERGLWGIMFGGLMGEGQPEGKQEAAGEDEIWTPEHLADVLAAALSGNEE